MIVYGYGSAWGSVDLSPFCVKLQTWLRMAGLPYEARVGDVRKMPKRKLPAIELDGRVIGDSGLVIELLRQRHGDPLGDDALDSGTRAQARALRALLETELYFATAWFRWAGADFERVYAPEIAAYARGMGVPGLLAPLAVRGARRDVLRLAAVSDYLADKPFISGAAPHTLDATVFAFLHCLLVPPFASPLRDFAQTRANLVAYHERMLARCWPELSAPRQRAAA
jgi:glutathione S-transferase